MTDVERRVREALRGLPEPPDRARSAARTAALDALAPARPRRRRRWALAIAAAGATALVAGAALAATDRLEVRIGRAPAAPPAATAGPPPGRVTVPAGARGLAVVAGGRLWLGTRSGIGVQGLAVTTAELSPNALYAAVGIGRSLVAMAPDGRRAWSHPTPGEVVAAAWAPNPIVVAYVVRRAGGHELHVIEGNGEGDLLVDPDVAPVRPSWRADTHAFAYVGADGRARVAAYPSLATRPLSAPGRRIGAVAYSPDDGRLALASTGPGLGVSLDDAGWVPFGGRGTTLDALAWGSSDELLIAGAPPSGEGPARIWRVPAAAGVAAKVAGSAYGTRALALAPSADGRLVAAVRLGDELQVWELAAPRAGLDRPLRNDAVLLRVPAGSGAVAALSVR